MTAENVTIPSTDQLIDVIGNSSVGIAVTDGSGAVVLHNKALSVLMGGETAHLGERILSGGAGEDLAGLLERLKKDGRIEHAAVTFRSTDGKDRPARVNAVLTGEGAGTRIHWVSRPELGERLPVSSTSTEDAALSDATAWIRAVDGCAHPSLAPAKDKEAVMREFYQVAPVAIHLIGVNGNVMHANPADVALVDYTATPTEYVGGHIRKIYEDQGLLDDFLSRWDEDSPIINFRANFVTKDGEPRPVLIFSTAQAEGGSVSNTRCFVFNDPEPGRARDTISAFGWPA
ncbi:PAS domain-containing protein [Streptomyces rectiverticillatus]|uniref:PAS domain-containing protein n=1 Tax=Streptomyces rectiverticillatus TaxID=173860 RepID=UPI0015C35CFC|nr:PAS domain-containing protein [Streptomyces rectiverticillatus]QLE74798.1 PAS domain-containing protein [Streptomyces rectiverticillatus]